MFMNNQIILTIDDKNILHSEINRRDQIRVRDVMDQLITTLNEFSKT